MKMHFLRRSRKIHRIVVPIAVAPIILVSLSGALYGSLINLSIEMPWLLKVHTGNFGAFNLQPFYSPVLGVLTLVVAVSGVPLLLSGGQRSSESLSPYGK
jgi:hypothetical protein